MGGRVDPALAIMQYLVAHDVPATIFMTGAMADNKYTDAGRQVLSIIAEHSSEFALGNHSYSHPDFLTLTAAQMLSELTSTEAAIARYVAISPYPLFRPPYGSYNPAVLSAVGGAGYRYVIMWDVDTADWKPESDGGPTASQITQHVLADAQDGSIVIMHLGGYNTADALPAIVEGLCARGFQLVTIPTLLGIP